MTGHICDPPTREGKSRNRGYIGYMEAFYPIEEWCKKYDPDCKCEGCKPYTWRGLDFNVDGCEDELIPDKKTQFRHSDTINRILNLLFYEKEWRSFINM